jgi:hypothetical protein
MIRNYLLKKYRNVKEIYIDAIIRKLRRIGSIREIAYSQEEGRYERK